MSAMEPAAAAAASAESMRLWDEFPDNGPLARLADLECRYDGAIPGHLRERALAEDWETVEQQRAAARVKFFDDMARFQVAAIRSRRVAGRGHAGLRRDLQLYLERRRHWRAEFARLREAVLLRPSPVAPDVARRDRP